MRGVGRWQEEESPEMKTPATLKEQVNSHPLDVDSGSEVWRAGSSSDHTTWLSPVTPSELRVNFQLMDILYAQMALVAITLHAEWRPMCLACPWQ